MNDILEEWKEAKERLDYWKAEEQRLRLEVASMEVYLHNRIKVTHPVNYNIDQDELREIWDDLTDEERECIKWRANIVEPKFRELDHNVPYELFDVVTSRPGLVQVKLK